MPLRLFDSQYRRHRLQYMLQSALAGIAMIVVLAGLRSISNAAVIASLGASTFIVFALPAQKSSQARFLIGGYAVGVAAGALGWWLARVVPLPPQLGPIQDLQDVVFGALSVGIALFVMVVTNTEHPPAAGLALGFAILDELTWLTVAVVLGGITTLWLVKAAMRPVLRDLL